MAYVERILEYFDCEGARTGYFLVNMLFVQCKQSSLCDIKEIFIVRLLGMLLLLYIFQKKKSQEKTINKNFWSQAWQ